MTAGCEDGIEHRSRADRLACPRSVETSVRTKRLMISPVQLGGILEGVSGSDDLPAKLTRREQEVAALACQGRSNADIAGKLVISVRTVESLLYSHTASSACQIEVRSPPFSDLSN